MCLAEGWPCTKTAQEAAGETLFERRHHPRRIAAPRFTEKKVDMLGHHDVAYDYEVMPLANLLHDFEE